jgi:DNA-binding transcriptional MerR regulator
MGDGPDDQQLRLDDLAAAAGVASTTVRLYQQKGLLHRPTLKGRTGWYDATHLARLRLIGELQEQGFSLAGIGRLLESWEQGRDLADLVGVEQQLDAVLHRRGAAVLEPAELAARFPTEAMTPELLARAMAAGLVEPTDDGRFRVPDPRFLDTGAELLALGVPVDTVLDEWARLADQMDDVAERFVRVFEDHLLPEDWRTQLDAERIRELATTLAQLQRLAGQVVLAALDASVARVAAQRLAELVPPDAQGS